MARMPNFTPEEIATAKRYAAANPPADLDPRIAALVHDLIGRVADRWTMLVLEVLGEFGEVRFTRFGQMVPASARRCSHRRCATWNGTRY